MREPRFLPLPCENLGSCIFNTKMYGGRVLYKNVRGPVRDARCPSSRVPISRHKLRTAPIGPVIQSILPLVQVIGEKNWKKRVMGTESAIIILKLAIAYIY